MLKFITRPQSTILKSINQRFMSEAEKMEGQVMTPDGIVTMILDALGYTGDRVLRYKCIEPSMGEGAFIIAEASRIIDCGKLHGISDEEILHHLRENLYGIEKDQRFYEKAIKRLNGLLEAREIPVPAEWPHLYHGNSLQMYTEFVGQFDICAGNPPYIRVHNLDEETREFIKDPEHFSFGNGTTDLYVAFYDIGIQLLNPSGRLGYISANSFLRNTSQKPFRDFLIQNKLVSKIWDFKTSKVFDGVDTYTCICVLDNNSNRASFDVDYREFNMYQEVVRYDYPWDSFEMLLDEKTWNLASEEDIRFLADNSARPIKVGNIAIVQNGIATNRDKIYVGKAWLDPAKTIPYRGKHTDRLKRVWFNGSKVESTILRRCVKASTYSGAVDDIQYILFPYKTGNGTAVYHKSTGKKIEKGFVPLEEKVLKKKFPLAYQYLCDRYDELVSRDMDDGAAWFQFGRSQGLACSCWKKIVFKHLIDRVGGGTIVPYILDEDILVYSGLYTVADPWPLIAPGRDAHGDEKLFLNDYLYDQELNQIVDIFRSEEFVRYCCIVGKDMAGGWAAVSSKSVKDFGTNLTKFPNFPVDIPADDLSIADNNYLNMMFHAKMGTAIIKEAYDNIAIVGPTSPERVKPFHSFVAKILQFKLGPDYEIKANGYGESTEYQLTGTFGNKNTDICVLKDGKPLGAIEFKLLSHNFKQNLVNFKEGLLGEVSTMHGRGIVYGFCYLIPEKALYLSNRREFKKLDILSQKDLVSYRKMMNLHSAQAPDALFVGVYSLLEAAYMDSLVEDQVIDFTSREYSSAVKPHWSDYSFLSDIDMKEEFLAQNIGKFLDNFIASMGKRF